MGVVSSSRTLHATRADSAGGLPLSTVMPDVTTIEYTDANGTRRKVEFAEATLTDPPERREWERQGVEWRIVGSGPVSDLHIDYRG